MTYEHQQSRKMMLSLTKQLGHSNVVNKQLHDKEGGIYIKQSGMRMLWTVAVHS